MGIDVDVDMYIDSDTVPTLRVQSTHVCSIYGFSIRHRNPGLGVYASYLGSWNLRVMASSIWLFL